MLYVNEYTNEKFSNKEDCLKAEKEYESRKAKERAEAEKKSAERKAMAKEVEDARKAVVAARSKYAEVLEAFCEKYGTYHTSLTDEDVKRAIPTLFGFLDDLFL